MIVIIVLFDYEEYHTFDGIKFRLYYQFGKRGQGKFDLHIAIMILEVDTQYFDVPYSLPNLDRVAIHHVAVGAMYNHSFVTYRKPALLYDDQQSYSQTTSKGLRLLAHELVHHWFGYLVPIKSGAEIYG